MSVHAILSIADDVRAGYTRIEATTAAAHEAAMFILQRSLGYSFNCYFPSGSDPLTTRVSSIRVSLPAVQKTLADADRVAALSARILTAWEKGVARTQVINGPLPDFRTAVVAASGGKLLAVPGSQTTIEAPALMPVTHFKALVRATRYDGKGRTFDLVGSTIAQREKVLETAEKLARSTKKVTRADIAARKAHIAEAWNVRHGKLGMDWREAFEDYGKELADKWKAEGRLDDEPGTMAPYVSQWDERG